MLENEFPTVTGSDDAMEQNITPTMKFCLHYRTETNLVTTLARTASSDSDSRKQECLSIYIRKFLSFLIMIVSRAR